MAAFAKYDGIDGESQDANHDKWIDVLSLDWGAHRSGGGATGQSRRRGAAIVEDMGEAGNASRPGNLQPATGCPHAHLRQG